MNSEKRVTADTTLSDILSIPKAEKILAKHKVPCLTCPFAKIEMERLKIGEICKMYGIKASELILELNSIYKK